MAEQLATLVFDIQSFSGGITDYEGVQSVEPQINDAELTTHRRTGKKYPSVMEQTQTDEFPVVLGITTRDAMVPLQLIAAGTQDWTVVGKADNGKTVTIVVTGGRARRPRSRWNARPNQFGEVTVEIVAVSADGDTLPITITKST